jgi:hypothetical protein
MSAAPGGLEQVRALLNTWEIPNDTRTAVDRLLDLARDAAAWRTVLPDIPVPVDPADAADLAGVRDRLRDALGQERPASLQSLVERGWRVRLGRSPDERSVSLVPDRTSTRAAVLALVLAAIQEGQWHRLRACPDCGWVFYDSSRNARRTWCSMTAEDGARGCGSIAKTRAYRSRQRHFGGTSGTEGESDGGAADRRQGPGQSPAPRRA